MIMHMIGLMARVIAMVTALGACSGGSSGQPSPTVMQLIRGTAVSSFSCVASGDGPTVQVPPASVVELRVCPILAPEPFDQPNHPISLRPGSVQFNQFVSALSLPDVPANEGQLCPEYAELLPTIVAKTATVALRVHPPSDACGHILPAVRSALTAAEGRAPQPAVASSD
jgi:hypothetical protein